VTEVEKVRGRDLAARLPIKVLTRIWQMLLKGIAEVQAAPKPLAAADMVLVRLCYAADLPTPDDLVRQLMDGTPASARPPSLPSGGGGGGAGGGPRAALSAVASVPRPAQSVAPGLASPVLASPTPARVMTGFPDIVALAIEKRDLPLKLALERFVRLVAFEDGRIDMALEPGAPQTLANDLSRKLTDWTSRRWVVVVASEPGAATLREQAEARQAEMLSGIRADPLVRAAMAKFPGAEIVDVRDNGADAVDAALPPAPSDADDFDADSAYTAEDI
jgi:DNA polymerase-3 subunit gamma/tau